MIIHSKGIKDTTNAGVCTFGPLCLPGNDLGNEGCEELAGVLKKADGSSGAPALTSLDLSGNGLEGPRACKPLADVLRVTARSPGESNPLQDQRSVRGAHTHCFGCATPCV